MRTQPPVHRTDARFAQRRLADRSCPVRGSRLDQHPLVRRVEVRKRAIPERRYVALRLALAWVPDGAVVALIDLVKELLRPSRRPSGRRLRLDVSDRLWLQLTSRIDSVRAGYFRGRPNRSPLTTAATGTGWRRARLPKRKRHNTHKHQRLQHISQIVGGEGQRLCQ